MVSDEFTLRFNSALVRSAVFGFWWRSMGIRYLLAYAMLALCVAYLAWQGDRSWMIGALGAVLILGAMIPAVVLVTQYRHAFAKLRGMRNPEARLTVGEAGLTITSDRGRSEIPWSTVTGIWRFPDFWLLVFSRSQFITIPLESVPLDVRSRIMASVENAGGNVRG